MKKLIAFALLLLIGSAAVWAGEPFVIVRFEGNSPLDESMAQFELMDSDGNRVLINVYDPHLLSSPATAKDVLLTTQPRNDDFSAAFPGRQLMAEAGEIRLDSLRVYGIASVHLYNQQPQPKNGSNYIYVVEMAGLRVADFGGIGQNALTAEQLKALGTVDIALAPLYNLDNRTNIDNLRGFNLMEQVQPKLIIPTGMDLDTAKHAAEIWKGAYCEGMEFKVDKGRLAGPAQVIFMGPKAKMFGKVCKLQPVSG